jgi:glycosyltransferase involved in cell wall biosynthesis
MRICYVLLSTTFGMHQYTADLANRLVRLGHEVHLVTTAHYPAHRYLPAVEAHVPLHTRTTGFSAEGLRLASAREVVHTLRAIQPDVVHLTGPHLWNLQILGALRRAGVPTVHTLHDLDPHLGSVYGPLLYVWNRRVLRLADHILVHGVCYHERLVDMGVAPERVTCTPLLHLFLGHTWLGEVEHLAREVQYERCVLFFGRLERYKGVDHLLTAWGMMGGYDGHGARLILAGPGNLGRLWAGPLPPDVELRNHLVEDEEALALFRRCGILILPYTGATQSALIPAAYFFHKPVIAAPSGALDEYVVDGQTGWMIEPEHPPSLARCLAGALADVSRLARMGRAGRAWYDDSRRAEEAELRRMYERVARRG